MSIGGIGEFIFGGFVMKRIASIVVLLFVVSFNCFSGQTVTGKSVYRISFVEHSDGCLVLPNNSHRYYSGSTSRYSNPTLQHHSDTSRVNADIKAFNAQCQRLHAVPKNNFQKAFANTPSGHYLYVYEKTSTIILKGGELGYRTNSSYGSLPDIPPEKVPLYTYTIWEYRKP